MAIFLFNNPRRHRKSMRLKSGFTLVETLVAITILTLALGGPMTLATRSIKDSLASRNKVVAFYLAHEAIEYVKNKRDSNFLYQICFTSNGPIPPNSPPPSCPTALTNWLDGQSSVLSSLNCTPLLFDGSNYSCSSGSSTIFSRQVTMTNPDGSPLPITGNEIKVEATVTWTDYGQRTVTLTQNMFNLAP